MVVDFFVVGVPAAATIFLPFLPVGLLAVVTGFVVGFLAVVGVPFFAGSLGLVEVTLSGVFGFGFGGGGTTGPVAARPMEFAATNKRVNKLTTRFFKSVLLGFNDKRL